MEETFIIRSHGKHPDHIRAEVSIIEDSQNSYQVWEDMENCDIRTFDDKYSFWEAVIDAGLTQEDVSTMVEGGMIFKGDCDVYVGLERYEHGSRVYAMCQHGNFPDRIWDVSPIVGWINPAGMFDCDLIHTAREFPIDQKGLDARIAIRQMLEADIKVYNDAVNGNCWGYKIILFDGDLEQDEDSCWGFLGDSDYCRETAIDVAKEMLKSYEPPKFYTCECCGSQVPR